MIAWGMIFPAKAVRAKEPMEFAPKDTAFFARIASLRKLSAKTKDFLPQIDPEIPPNLAETLLFGYLGVTSPALGRRVDRNSPWGIALPEKGQAPVVIVPTTDFEGFMRALKAGAREAPAEGPYERAGSLYVRQEENYACVSTSKEMLERLTKAQGRRSLAEELSKSAEIFEAFTSSDLAIYGSAEAVDLERTAKLVAEKVVRSRKTRVDEEVLQNAVIGTLKEHLSEIRWVIFAACIEEAEGLSATLFVKCRPEGKIGKALLAQEPVKPEWLGLAEGEPLFLLETHLNLEPFGTIYLDFCRRLKGEVLPAETARAEQYLSLFTGRSFIALFASPDGTLAAEEVHEVRETETTRSFFRDNAEKGYILFPFSPTIAGRGEPILRKGVDEYKSAPIDLLEKQKSDSTTPEEERKSIVMEGLFPAYVAFLRNKVFIAAHDVTLLKSLIARAEGKSSDFPQRPEVSQALAHLPEKNIIIGFISLRHLARLRGESKSITESAGPSYSAFSAAAGKDYLRIDLYFPLEELIGFVKSSSSGGHRYISSPGAGEIP